MILRFSPPALSQIPAKVAASIRNAIITNEQVISTNLSMRPHSMKVTLFRSPNDPSDHWVVDVFQLDTKRLERPFASLHVYKHDYSVKVLKQIRDKALEIYNADLNVVVTGEALAAATVEAQYWKRRADQARLEYFDGATSVLSLSDEEHPLTGIDTHSVD
ncbi:hypothetical protein C0989_005673 [Termitomyces sp. Mn162]|nr:hypothetical protein C0989_005673 [Termitomyces sp. Mn162]